MSKVIVPLMFGLAMLVSLGMAYYGLLHDLPEDDIKGIWVAVIAFGAAMVFSRDDYR